MRGEIWKTVRGSKRQFSVSNMGRVRSNFRFYKGGSSSSKAKIIKPSKCKYPKVYACMDGIKKSHAIHLLVAEHFIGRRPIGKECCHLNGNPKDARLTNLAWVTRKVNNSHKIIHGTYSFGEKCLSSKLRESDVKKIMKLVNSKRSKRSIAKQFGVSPANIRAIWLGNSWKHITRPKAVSL